VTARQTPPGRRPAPRALARERGFALLAVLWMLILLAALAASYSLTTRTSVALARNAVGSAEAEALADAGIHRAVAGLLVTGGDSQGFRADGTPYAWAFANGQVRFSIEDEGGKIDLNGASEALLAALFRTVGLNPKDAGAIAAAIVDFRDDDSNRLPNGAEDRDYARERLPHGAKDAPFQLVEELLQVKGMTGPVFRQVAPLLTVYTGTEQPEAKVAPPEVAAVLAEMKGGIGGRRGGAEAGLAAGRDARRGRQAEAVEDRQATVGRDGDRATSALADEADEDAGSGLSTYSIHAEAMTAGGAVFVRHAVVRITGDQAPPYAVLAWDRGRRWLFPPDR
jgi:general secretion pathway protein K